MEKVRFILIRPKDQAQAKLGAGVVWIGVPSQRGGHGNGLGRGVGIGLVWAGTTAAMPAMNKSKQSITPKSRTLNFILGVSMRSMCSAERVSIPNCTTTKSSLRFSTELDVL